MNAWPATATLIPSLSAIPLGAAVLATFMQRDPVRKRSRATGEDARDRRRDRNR